MHKTRDLLEDPSLTGYIGSPISDGTHASSTKHHCTGRSGGKLDRSSSFDMQTTSSVMSFQGKIMGRSPCKLEGARGSKNAETLRALCLKKSRSLCSGLDKQGEVSNFLDHIDEADRRLFSCDADGGISHDPAGCSYLNNNIANVEPCAMHMDLNQGDLVGLGVNQQPLDLVNEEVVAQVSSDLECLECLNGNDASEKHVGLHRSYSLSDVKDDTRILKGTSTRDGLYCSRSFNDLSDLKSSAKAILSEEGGCCFRIASVKWGNVSLPNVSEAMSITNRDFIISAENSEADHGSSRHSSHSTKAMDCAKIHAMNVDVSGCENRVHEEQDSCMPFSPVKHVGDVKVGETVPAITQQLGNTTEDVGEFEEYPRHWWDGLSPKSFSAKRIEHWVSTIDIQNPNSMEELGECSCTAVEINYDGGINVAPHVVQVANNYISALTLSSTTAQMANFGLPTIPQLSIYHGIPTINLSGNAIVRIAAGVLPKGLHVLNLSRNAISVIEGLRDLTRLRVLDLSYNRILRIGHGLASCSSLKELYLAGNKISEIEGLHRLLKLHILDLSYNKISTTKCVGQLAANYSSLQVLNLEGNPAQKNFGANQLKKSLTGLLPRLAYLNRQAVGATSSKETSDRASSSAAMHLFERGIRSEHRTSRKTGHGSVKAPGNGLVQASSSSSSSPKQVVAKAHHHHERISAARSKLTHHQVSIDSRLLGVQMMSSSMRRIRSEGTMNVL